MADIHATIRKVFNIRGAKDNLPYAGGKAHTRLYLGDLFRELGFTKGAEIGVRRAHFSLELLKRNPDLMLFCVDPWEPYNRKYTKDRQDKIYKEAVKSLSGYDKAHIIRKRSMDAIKDFEDGWLDFVYIDGNHRFDYVCPDIIFWAQKVKKGGIIACHDYYSFGWGGVMQAVNGYTSAHHIDPWYVTKEITPSVFWVNK